MERPWTERFSGQSGAGAARKCGRVLCGTIRTWVSHELRTTVSAQTILADLEAQGTGPGAFGPGNVGRHVLGNGTWL